MKDEGQERVNLQKMVEKEMENAILTAQKSEITEHFVYQKLSQSAMDPHNKSVLKQISDDELKHYDFNRKSTTLNIGYNLHTL